jgi:cytochrome c
LNREVAKVNENEIEGQSRKTGAKSSRLTRWLVGIGLAGSVTACASIDPALITREAGKEPYQAPREELVKAGAELWKDPSLGNSGLSCDNCHMMNAQFKKSFKQPYPHEVAMVNNMAGDVGEITAAQMVQFCMLAPMEAEPLPWDSKELAALAAYVDDVVQPAFAADKAR